MLGFYSKVLWNALTKKYKYLWDKPPKNIDELYAFAGSFTYASLSNGFIKILGNWEENNIVSLKLPIKDPKGKNWNIKCHKKVRWHLEQIFREYMGKNLDETYPIKQLGCFVPRHKMQNPARSLSLHSWGLAVDINWATNKVGTHGDMPLELVNIFKNYGFCWGGFWTNPLDPMHFQFYEQ